MKIFQVHQMSFCYEWPSISWRVTLIIKNSLIICQFKAYYVLEDVTKQLGDLVDNLDFDAGRLQEIEHRLDTIKATLPVNMVELLMMS